MTRSRLLAALAVAITVCSGLLASTTATAAVSTLARVRTAASGGTWGTAIEVPGTAALNQGGNAKTYAVSCTSSGNCAAGGFYTDSSAKSQAFVAAEQNGHWGTALEVPGTPTLNQGGNASVISVSCPSAGNCTAGGSYNDAIGVSHAFVAAETSGTWDTAADVPGLTAVDDGGPAWIDAVSCPSAGNCSVAGGYYAHNQDQVWVAGETNGLWGAAEQVPGTALLNAGGLANLNSLSCPSAGNCAAAGEYQDASRATQAFVVREVQGTWKTAQEVPGTAKLNVGGFAQINSVSCASARNCSAGGFYTDSTGDGAHALVVGATKGTWGTAIEVPGTPTLNRGKYAVTVSVSCPSLGNCGAVGNYSDSARLTQPFVASETNGTWGTAAKVPSIGALDTAGYAGFSAVSCASVGNCAAAGEYEATGANYQLFVVDEVNGTWGSAAEVPGIATLNKHGWAMLKSLSCARAGTCSAGGFYTDASGKTQAFVVSE